MTETQELESENRQELSTAHELPTVRRLTAVRRALSRESTELDILVTTSLTILESGPRLREELVDEVCQSWPGTRLSRERVERALEVAEEADLVVSRSGDSLLGEQVHAVGDGERPLKEAKLWAEKVLDDTRENVCTRVEGELSRQLGEEELTVWFHLLIEAVSAGIVEAFAAYRGNLNGLSDLSVIPANFDRGAIRDSIDRAASSPEMAEVLRAMALEAIDPSVSFGTGLVTYLATGYILHAFIARRDLAENVGSSGPLVGQWALLDTPVLVGLLERTGRGASLDKALAMACEAGMHLVVPEHVVEELRQLVANAKSHGDVDAIRRGLAEGTSPESLRQLTDGIVAVWLSHVEDDGKVVSFEQFSKKANMLVDELASRYGVVQLRFNQGGDQALYGDADRCATALAEEVESRRRFRGDARVERDPTGRGEKAIDDDGKTMAMAWQRRRDYSGNTWPGAWVITPDTRMGPAFRSVDRSDDLSLTLTPPQWAVLVGGFGRPASERELAQAAAQLLTQDTFFDIAAKYPPKTALQLARTLSRDGDGVEVDLRVAQTSLEEILDREAHDDPDSDKRTAASLMRKRISRRDELARSQVATVQNENKELRRRLKSSTDTAEEHAQQAQRLQGQLEVERTNREQVEAQLRRLNEELQSQREERDEINRAAEQELSDLRGQIDGLEEAASESEELAGRLDQLEEVVSRKNERWEKLTRYAKGLALTLGLSMLSLAAIMWAPWLSAHAERGLILAEAVIVSVGLGGYVIWPSERTNIVYGVIVAAVLALVPVLFGAG